MAVDKKKALQNTFVGLLVAAGLFASILLLSNSWIKIVLLALVAGSCVAWIVVHGKLKKSLYVVVLSLLIFGLCFASGERYVYWNAGYPSTYNAQEPDVTLVYPNILNVSLAEVVQSAEKSSAFTLFQLEYPGAVTFESILLDTTFPHGRVEVTFYCKVADTGFGVISSAGQPYHASNIHWIGQPPSSRYPQQQSAMESLREIDSRGLDWFYSDVSREYLNRAGTVLNVNSLEVSTEWFDYNSSHYQGLSLQILGYQKTGTNLWAVFSAAYSPDGTLLNINTNIPTTTYPTPQK
jgi:hypothetical protein